MNRVLFASLLLLGAVGVVGCAPAPTVSTATVTPMLIKVSDAAPRGGTVTIQGRYLGGPTSGVVRLGADEDGKGGYTFPASSVQSWTDNQIVLTIPDNAPVGGSWLFIEVDGLRSTGLPYSVRQ
ncbi:IPT/TIG domain-containing protein [Deinococcus lacus]|uniref:IPT/TIG domain-containing protein n=1 Tax=Deinococcus lacus TaxID=392561 RepID=A0ABW1YAE1_9DEIO